MKVKHIIKKLSRFVLFLSPPHFIQILYPTNMHILHIKLNELYHFIFIQMEIGVLHFNREVD